MTRRSCLAAATLLGGMTRPALAAATLRIAVSDYAYKDVVEQIGGGGVAADTLDPAAPGDGEALARYALVVCGGTAQDSWLRAAAQSARRPVRLAGPAKGASAVPWYDLRAMADLGAALAADLGHLDPPAQPAIAANLAAFRAGFTALDRKIDEIARDYANSAIFLGDTLFAPIAERLKFDVWDKGYVKALQGAAPMMKSLATLKEAIAMRKASIFVYDRESAGAETQQLVDAANDAGVPVVGVRLRMPHGLRYQQWMLRQLNAVKGALNEAAP